MRFGRLQQSNCSCCSKLLTTKCNKTAAPLKKIHSKLNKFFQFESRVNQTRILEKIFCQTGKWFGIKRAIALTDKFDQLFYPPASEASKEVANLTCRKIHTPLHMVPRICLSLCPSVCLWRLFNSSYTQKTKSHFKSERSFLGKFLRPNERILK